MLINLKNEKKAKKYLVMDINGKNGKIFQIL